MAAVACAVDDCDGKARARGMCPAHYQRWRKYGDPSAFGPVTRYGKPPPDGACSIPGCDREFYGRGWCGMHYRRWRRWGDPMASQLDRLHDGRCSVDGCERPYDARGLCGTHFKAARYVEDPYIALQASHRRRVKLRSGVTFTVADRDRKRLLASPCLACGSANRIQIDHLIPVDRGGSHGVGNLIALCGRCNSSKRNQTWMEWRASGKPRALAIFGRGASE